MVFHTHLKAIYLKKLTSNRVGVQENPRRDKKISETKQETEPETLDWILAIDVTSYT